MTHKLSVRSFIEGEKGEEEKSLKLQLKKRNKLFQVSDTFPLTLKLTKLDKERVLAHFETTINIKLSCIRCLEKFSHQISLSFDRVYSTDPESDELPIEDGRIEVKQPVYEELILELPAKPVCSKDCQGLCQVCGQNLNKGECDCPAKPKGRKEFQKLKKLKE